MNQEAADVHRRTGPEPQHRWATAGGVTIAADSWGEPSAPSVVLMHGGGQTRHAWKGAGETLAASGLYAVAIDTRGHGDSSWPEDGDYDLDSMVDDLVAVVERTGSEKVALVGASMGGAVALLGVGHGRIHASALVLVDVAPRTELAGVERVRAFMTQRRDGFGSLDEAAEAVAAYQPHRRRPRSNKGLLRNLRLGADGRYRWHWDPRLVAADIDHEARSMRLCSAARRVEVPTLLVRGQRSDVLSASGVEHFRSLVPHAQTVDVADAAHMVAGDENDVFVEVLRSFLLETLPGAGNLRGGR